MNKPIIVPLDGMTPRAALNLAERLTDRVWGFKVNDLLIACGSRIVTELREFGQVMADPKLHDIPNTVKNSAGVLADAGATFITVHASGGVDMLRAACERARGILAITVLTSLDEQAALRIFGRDLIHVVLSFAHMAKEAGCAGIVCSPKELSLLGTDRDLDGLIRVVPGIRPAGADQGDQQRTDTPAAAIKAGADKLVIGRPITEKGDPVDNVRRIMDEIGPALEVRQGRKA